MTAFAADQQSANQLLTPQTDLQLQSPTAPMKTCRKDANPNVTPLHMRNLGQPPNSLWVHFQRVLGKSYRFGPSGVQTPEP